METHINASGKAEKRRVRIKTTPITRPSLNAHMRPNVRRSRACREGSGGWKRCLSTIDGKDKEIMR